MHAYSGISYGVIFCLISAASMSMLVISLNQ